MQKERLVQRAARMGKFLCQRLAQLCKTLPIFADFRGLGLLLAVILREPQARALQDACRQRGLLVNAIGDSVIRLAPPLIVGQEEINQATDILSAAAQSL
jgi:4-aminobutyrate aminotransferase-like enzyme